MHPQHLKDLLKRYIEGTANDDETAQLIKWYREADINDVAWPGAEADAIKSRERILAKLQQDIRVRRPRVIDMRRWAAAASILVAIGIVLIYFFSVTRDEYLAVNNASGAVRRITLPDSSTVWLNAATTLKYNKDFINSRNVLIDGHAYFDVTRDPSHPFTIHTGELATTVVGTSFTIKAYKSDSLVQVDVLTGKVKVASDQRELAVLSPATRISYNSISKQASLTKSDTASITAWMRGQLQFRGEPLTEIGKTVGRWYGYTIIFEDAAAGNCRYYLNLESKHPIEEILPIISELTGMQYNINTKESTILFSGKACN